MAKAPRIESRGRVVVALGLAQTLAWASSYYLPAMLARPMASELGVETPTVFAAFSLALVVSALLGPSTGRAIDRWGGRPVLMTTSLVFAFGLVALGLVSGPVSLFAAWMLVGVGMGSGLYEAAFSALVRLYGNGSRNAITGITLIAGFASTVGWPLSTLLESHVGWRGTCFAWAALHLAIGLPLNASLPKADPRPGSCPASPAAPLAASDAPPLAASDASSLAEPDASPLAASPVPSAPAGGTAPTAQGRTAVILAFVFAATWFISTAMAAHLPRLLQAGGASLTTAVAVGALIGPAQVGGRLLEFGLLRRVHPLLSGRLAALMHPIGAALLALFGSPAAAVFAILHGAGNGILTIAKGTLPLVFFGPQGYGHRQGVLSVPARMAQAKAPWLFGVFLERWGANAMWISASLGLAVFVALMCLPKPAGETGSTGAA